MGVVLLVFFAGGSFVQWFPLRGHHLASTGTSSACCGKIADYFWHIALPVTAMVLGGFAVITILTKNSVLEEIRKQYVLTARAKGVDERKVLWRHVFRNALIPIMTGFPAAFVGAFFSGSLLIETLFSLDGLGLLSYESVIRRDYPVVFGSLFLFTHHRPADHAAARPELPLGRSAREVLRLSHDAAASHAADRAAPPAARKARRAAPGGASAATASATVSLIIFLGAVRPEPARRSAVERQAARRALRRAVVLPGRADAARDDLRRRLPDADRLSRPADPREPAEAAATSRSSRPIRYHHSTINYFAKEPNPARAERARTCSAPTTAAATCWRGCCTAFASRWCSRCSSTAVCTVFGVLYGAIQGYFAGWTDIAHGALQRDLERDADALHADHLLVAVLAELLAAGDPAVAVRLARHRGLRARRVPARTARSTTCAPRARWARATARSCGATSCRTA